MAFFYVKAGGTAAASTDDGRYTALNSGSFADALTNDWGSKGLGAATDYYYTDVGDAFLATTVPTNGDTILISDAHLETATSTITLAGAGGITSEPIYYISVDDSNADQSSIGASAQIQRTGATADVQFSGGTSRVSYHGLYFESDDEIRTGGNNSHLWFEDCTFRVTGTLDRAFYIGHQSVSAVHVNSTLIADGATTTQPVALDFNGHIKFIGGVVQTDQTNIDSFINAGFGAAGGTIEVIGMDLSVVGGTGSYLIHGVGNSTSDHGMNIKFHRCQLASDLTGFIEEDLYGVDKRVEIYNCSGTSSDAEYQLYINQDQHTAEDDTTFYRDASIAFPDSNQKISLKVVTAAHANRLNPFWLDTPVRYAQLSDTDTDALNLFLISADSGLTDQDVWVDIVYPDGTNKHVPNRVSTVNTDPLATGTALTADTSSTWTGLTTETRYKITVDTSSDAGIDSYPILRIYVAKPSTTFYIDPVVTLS